MYGKEKSDSLIVPEKQANKARSLAAESVEGSGGNKRNAEEQNMVRTQSRDSVSQAQARIREAVSRQILKLGAGCGNSACPDLSGGRGETLVPTGIQHPA
jgi:hypothetical protein